MAGVTRDVLPLFDAGAIRVVIDTVVPLRDAARAHELLESKQTVGKLILDNRDVNGRTPRASYNGAQVASRDGRRGD